MKQEHRKGRVGFTLVELLVVLAIIGTLVGLLLPAVQRAREAANRVSCGNNLKQIGLALHGYHDSKGSFPAGYLCRVQADPVKTSPGWGWASLLLPYLEQESLYRQINLDVPVEDPTHAAVRTTVLGVFICPSDYHTGVFDVPVSGGAPVQAATNSYAASFGTKEIDDDPGGGDGMFFRNSRVRFTDVADGTSNTLAVGERPALFTQTPWAGAANGGTARVTPGAPTTSTGVEAAPVLALAHTGSHSVAAADADPDDFFTPHAGAALFLFADGSVRPVKKDVPQAVLRALSTRAGGEYVNADDF
jgi:prepilin-type N-terminal cleavage/methylation domain-containing protein/prepilin-type processing-associated H-X9-DG protein